MIEKVENEREMLERHIAILQLVFEEAPIGIVALSNETGYPHHKVRYSLRILEEEGLIEPTKKGAVTTEDASAFVETASDRVGEVIERLGHMKTEASSVEQ